MALCSLPGSIARPDFTPVGPSSIACVRFDQPHRSQTASPLSSSDPARDSTVHLALPKGRMQDAVMRLLDDAGIQLTFDRRGYRPTISLPAFETKILKPQNIVEMLHLGSRDIGFAGADWVME